MAPTVRVDDDVYEELKAHAEPFVDTPNTVLRRLLGLSIDRESSEGSDPAGEEEVRSAPLASVSVKRSEVAKQQRKPRSSRRPSAKQTRAPAGALLPEESYEMPLLSALVEMGGSGPSRDIIESVGALLADKLTELDRATIKSGGIRWQSRVQFVRLRLVEQGLMLKDTGRGIWGISDAGRMRVEQEKAGAA